jgi:glycine/D-amino acid oxidase-like deaminating enzyme
MTTTNALSGQHVIVIGAGYAGLMCALQLAPAVRVTLVDPAGYFTERIRSHQRAANRPDITHPLSAGSSARRRELTRATDPVATIAAQPILVRAGAVQAAPSPASAQRSPGTGYGA